MNAPVLTPPVILLVEPQLVENIGMTARAMMNTRFDRDADRQSARSVAFGRRASEAHGGAASGADAVLENAKIFATPEEAIADLNYVYATTSRSHDMVNRILTPRAAIPDMVTRAKTARKSRVMFGPERTGLINDHIVLANAQNHHSAEPRIFARSISRRRCC